MKFGEYNCECGANVCGDPERHDPKCPKCGKIGSWDNIQENDIASAFVKASESFEDALIQPEDPFPQRTEESEDRELKYFDWHECKCGVEYMVEHYPNCPDCGLESIPENAAIPMRLTYTDEELRQHADDKELMEKFSLVMATMNRYNQRREEQGLPPITYDEDYDNE